MSRKEQLEDIFSPNPIAKAIKEQTEVLKEILEILKNGSKEKRD